MKPVEESFVCLCILFPCCKVVWSTQGSGFGFAQVAIFRAHSDIARQDLHCSWSFGALSQTMQQVPRRRVSMPICCLYSTDAWRFLNKGNYDPSTSRPQVKPLWRGERATAPCWSPLLWLRSTCSEVHVSGSIVIWEYVRQVWFRSERRFSANKRDVCVLRGWSFSSGTVCGGERRTSMAAMSANVHVSVLGFGTGANARCNSEGF